MLLLGGANAVAVGRLESDRAVATADKRAVNFVMVVGRMKKERMYVSEP